MSVARVLRAVRNKLGAGIKGALDAHNAIYLEEVTSKQTTPVGSKKRHGASYRGEVVERSTPGEFPRREFGEASEHMQVIAGRGRLQGAWGVTESGMPLIHLAYGSHPVSGEAYERLGPVDSWLDNETTIRAAFEDAADLEKG